MFKYLFVILAIIFGVNIYSQNNSNKHVIKGDEHFYHLEYARAIKFYEKALKKYADTALLRKLAFSYRYVHSYDKAEIIYERIIRDHQGIDPIFYYYYAEALKNNRKYLKAKDQYLIFADKTNNLELGQKFAIACDRIHNTGDSINGVNVLNVEELNSTFSEFSPVLLNGQMTFISDRKRSFYEHDEYGGTGTAFLSLFKSAKTGKDSLWESPIPVSGKLHSDFHDGPVTYTMDGKWAIMNRVIPTDNKDTSFHGVIKAGIYIFDLENNIQYDFPYNSHEYSVGHPALSPDGSRLFFSSNMPGGYGGQDIYYVDWYGGEKWGFPKNLGDQVNTPGDEVFPFSRKKEYIYFSSDGHVGHGGWDIFSSLEKQGEWSYVFNLRAPINSSRDDFGLFFTGSNQGFLSSNRSHGKGKDDIYSFSIKRRKIKGRILDPETGRPLTGMAFFLLDSDLNKIDSIMTDELGFFFFENLDPEANYQYLMNAQDQDFIISVDDPFLNEDEGIKVYASSEDLANNSPTKMENKPFFNYRPLKPETDFGNPIDFVDQSIIELEKPIYVMRGRVSKKLNLRNEPMQKVKLVLKSEDGTFIKVVYSDKEGYFEFNELPGDFRFVMTMGEEDVDYVNDNRIRLNGNMFCSDPTIEKNKWPKFFFSGNTGRKLVMHFNNDGGSFDFDFLTSEFFMLDMKDEKDNAGMVVELYNETKVREKDANIQKTNGTKQTKMNNWETNNKDQNRNFISYSTSILFNFNDFSLTKEANGILIDLTNYMEENPDLLLKVAAYTDSRGDDFYNFELSTRRSETVKSDLIKKGIGKNRITAIGMGETKLLNGCVDMVPCSDTQHSQNRRVEFIFESNSLN